MANNSAQLIYDSVNNYSDVKKLINTQENIYIDFKESATKTGALLDDDRRNFSKAASGFAHQDGGVIVWGIEAKQDGEEGIDRATDLKPVYSLSRFYADINSYIKISTVPVVNGILVKKIFENDDEVSDCGFLVVFFPKSNAEHQYKGVFYKRMGDSFVSLASPQDVKELFFRERQPNLCFINQIKFLSPLPSTLQIPLIVKNDGKAIAKNVQVFISFDGPMPTVYDESGNFQWKISSKIDIDDVIYRWAFLLKVGVVIHVGVQIRLASLIFHSPPFAKNMRYKLLAENMLPVEGNINLDSIVALG